MPPWCVWIAGGPSAPSNSGAFLPSVRSWWWSWPARVIKAPAASVPCAKLASYQANGAQLGWLLIPAEQAVEVWPAQGPAQRLEGGTRLDGGTLLPGLQLDLTAIWQV